MELSVFDVFVVRDNGAVEVWNEREQLQYEISCSEPNSLGLKWNIQFILS